MRGSKSVFITSSPRWSSFKSKHEKIFKERSGIYHEKGLHPELTSGKGWRGSWSWASGGPVLYMLLIQTTLPLGHHGNSVGPYGFWGPDQEKMKRSERGGPSSTCFWQRSTTDTSPAAPTKPPTDPKVHQPMWPTPGLDIPHISSSQRKILDKTITAMLLERLGWKLKMKQKIPSILQKEKDEKRWYPIHITCNLQPFPPREHIRSKIKKKKDFVFQFKVNPMEKGYKMHLWHILECSGIMHIMQLKATLERKI